MISLQWLVTTITQHDFLSDIKTEMPDSTAVDDNDNVLVCFVPETMISYSAGGPQIQYVVLGKEPKDFAC